MKLDCKILLLEGLPLVRGLRAAGGLSVDADRLAPECYRFIDCFGFYNLPDVDRAGINFTFPDRHVLLVKGNSHRTA